MLTAAQLTELRDSPAEPNRLIKAMALAGKTQVEMAAAVGVGQPHISDICKGNYKKLPLDVAQRLASVFGPDVTVDDLFPLSLVLREKPDRRAPESPLRRITDASLEGA